MSFWLANAFTYRGADIEAADKESWTPLLVAVVHGSTDAVDKLLERGAIDHLDGKGRNAMFLAAEHDQTNILKVCMCVCVWVGGCRCGQMWVCVSIYCSWVVGCMVGFEFGYVRGCTNLHGKGHSHLTPSLFVHYFYKLHESSGLGEG